MGRRVTDNVVPFNRRIAPATWSDGTVQHDCKPTVTMLQDSAVLFVKRMCQVGRAQEEQT